MNGLSICSAAMLALGVTATATSAFAQLSGTDYIMGPNYTVTDMDSVGGASSAGSFAAAAMMGAHGYSNFAVPSGWETTVITNCKNASGPTLWPGQCTPSGMATATKNMTGNTWITQVFQDSAQTSALNAIVNALYGPRSPSIVPIYGQADHWAAVYYILATYNGSSTWTIKNIKFYDGGPTGQDDSGFNGYFSGFLSVSGNTWKNTYYKVLTAINPSCDPNCTSDPYYNKYLVMWEPPPGTPNDEKGNFPRAPGILKAGQHMKSQIASMRVWDSLMANGVDVDPEVWGSIQYGVPGAAWEVHGLWPSGAQWDYYLVPILSNTTTAVGFVQVAADDGSFDSIFVPDQPVSFAPISMQQAQQMAHTTLSQGEHLTGGLLTWDPSGDAPIQKSPSAPYYEFGVMGPGKQDAGVVRVSLNGGAQVVRSQ